MKTRLGVFSEWEYKVKRFTRVNNDKKDGLIVQVSQTECRRQYRQTELIVRYRGAQVGCPYLKAVHACARFLVYFAYIVVPRCNESRTKYSACRVIIVQCLNCSLFYMVLVKSQHTKNIGIIVHTSACKVLQTTSVELCVKLVFKRHNSLAGKWKSYKKREKIEEQIHILSSHRLCPC